MKEIKNTSESDIFEHRLSSEFFWIGVNNTSDRTDTITKDINQRFIQFYFCLKGNATFHFNLKTYQQVLQEKYSFLLYNSEMSLPLNLSISGGGILYCMVISRKEFERILTIVDISMPDFINSENKKSYQKLEIPESLLEVFQKIQNIQFNSEWRKLNMLASVYEVLAEFFSHMYNADVCPYKSSEENMRKLTLAKEILIQEFKAPPTIIELANLIDLNQYKLKDGFKKIYGKSIQHYTFDYKMNLAKQMILEKKYKVKDLSEILGYEYSSHFISAFKKKFGITPKQYSLQL